MICPHQKNRLGIKIRIFTFPYIFQIIIDFQQKTKVIFPPYIYDRAEGGDTNQNAGDKGNIRFVGTVTGGMRGVHWEPVWNVNKG